MATSSHAPSRVGFFLFFGIFFTFVVSMSSMGIQWLSAAFLPEVVQGYPVIISLALHALLVGLVVFGMGSFSKLSDPMKARGFFRVFGLLILILVPQLLFDSFVILYWIVSLFTDAFAPMAVWPTSILLVGVVLALTLFGMILHGILIGRWRYTLRSEDLRFENLPESWNGLKVVQISDLHIGSFFNRHHKLLPAIEKINALEPDVIVFTGDLVNNTSEEAEGWQEVFSKLNAKLGKYSILGNHDYGDYIQWESEEAKATNLERLKVIHAESGFELLLNEHRVLEKDNEKIGLLGIENWGLPPFPQYGDLSKAEENTEDLSFKILLSHDPSHWEAQVTSDTNIDLTLSGHTHGMQFGLETKNFKWSPVKWRYPKWAGLYEENKQMLYVNRGLGFIGFPGRVGIWPEITLLKIYRK